jgi:succinoglycan biosynthesis protein ExoO
MRPLDFSDVSARPTVSVVMANYNGAAYLAAAIRSVQRQSLRNLELIVSDDASTDGSLQIVTELMTSDPRIRLLQGDRNCGPAVARNRALDVARGQWIAIVDSDDLIHPERFVRLIELAIRDDAGMVADDLLIFDSDPFRKPETLLSGRWICAPSWIKTVEFVRANQLYGRGPLLGYLKPIFRASAIRESAVHYDETLRIAEDYHFVLELLRLGIRFRVYPSLLYFYRKHSNSISHRLNQGAITALKAADERAIEKMPEADEQVLSAVDARRHSLNTALAYEKFLGSLKAGNLVGCTRVIRTDPKVLALLRLAIAARLRRRTSAPRTAKRGKPQVWVLSRQRVIGRTNGSSTYLLDLAEAIRKAGFDIHFLAPSPTTLGRWPFLFLSKDILVFKSFTIRGTWRFGRCVIATDPRQIVRAALAVLDRFLINRGWISRPRFNHAPYSIAQPLTREDQLYVARHGRTAGDFLIADYCFLTETFPYMLRPEARTAVVMHDRFSSRRAQFDALGSKDSVVSLSEEEERDRLAQADIILAIQHDEAQFVRQALPSHRVIVVPMAASPSGATQPERSPAVRRKLHRPERGRDPLVSCSLLATNPGTAPACDAAGGRNRVQRPWPSPRRGKFPGLRQRSAAALPRCGNSHFPAAHRLRAEDQIDRGPRSRQGHCCYIENVARGRAPSHRRRQNGGRRDRIRGCRLHPSVR